MIIYENDTPADGATVSLHRMRKAPRVGPSLDGFQSCRQPHLERPITFGIVRRSSASRSFSRAAALGAYQAGVSQALAEAAIHPDWVAGISTGAINSALIAGNPPEQRVDKLRQFWERITTDVVASWPRDVLTAWMKGDWTNGLMSQVSAGLAMMDGVRGFFTPRLPLPWLNPTGAIEATSFYDTASLKTTLEDLVDFDRINAQDARFSVGAVNVRSGNFVYFRYGDTDDPARARDGEQRSAAGLRRHRTTANTIGTAGWSRTRPWSG
jgi:hypothetical protein